MGFAESIKAFEVKALKEANKKVSYAIGNLFSQIVANTPSPVNPGWFAEGHLANQWYPMVGTFDNTNTSAVSPNGADSISRIKALLTNNILFLGRDNIVTMTNSCDYAYRAENLGWPQGEGANGWIWSGKVGAYKMVSKAVNNFKGAYS